MKSTKHILRYGTNADQRFFSGDFENCYNVIAINANMIASSPNAIALFVGKNTIDKKFFIDPITHLFQHSQTFISNANGEIKKSVDNLISNYSFDICGEKSSTQDKYDFIKKKIISEDISPDFIKKFTDNVISYQENLVINGDKSINDYSKYVDFVKSEDSSQSDIEIHQTPEFLVAPYFYIDQDAWIDKNILFLEEAIKNKSESKKVFAQIVISKRVFEKCIISNPIFESIITKYGNSNADGFLLWVDGYSEHDEISESLEKYKDFICNLHSKKGKPVYVLYGGYFSVCLTNATIDCLDGVAHGLEYGESREVVPVGGGIPVAKYYFYPLHKRINLKDMIYILQRLKIRTKEDFFTKICDCPVCREVIQSDVLNDFQNGFGKSKPSTFQRGKTLVTMNFSTTETKEKSLKHYLYNKKKEFDFVENHQNAEIIKELNASYAQFKDCIDSNNCQHIDEWARALSKK